MNRLVSTVVLSPRFGFVGVLLGLALLAGCEVSGEVEMKRLEEAITRDELREYLSIVDEFPGKKLPPLPSSVLTAPAWSLQRTLPVNELLQEQQKQLDERFPTDVIVRQLKTVSGLDRALRKEGWSVDRFASVTLVLSAAINRSTIEDEEMLSRILGRGRDPLKALEGDSRVFATLTDDAAFVVLDRAVWIPLVHRAEWLSRVAPESVKLVREKRKALEGIFPADLFSDPFAPFSRVLRDAGMPFEELPESGSDDDIPGPTLSSGLQPTRWLGAWAQTVA